MITIETYNNYYLKLISRINDLIKKRKNKKLFYSIKTVAKFLYETNQIYSDFDLENGLDFISKSFDSIKEKKEEYDILFFDSFGMNYRGLVNQYINGFISNRKKFLYVTYKTNKHKCNELTSKIISSGNEISLISDNYSGIHQLRELLSFSKSFYLYITPWDVTSLVCARLFNEKKYLIDLTDHAFWLGTNVIDKYIEFRPYGTSIAINYRNISSSKILYLPFYPLDNKLEFTGYPSPGMNKDNTIFSGGNIYKTIDKNLTFYNVIDNIMSNNMDYYFWYAGGIGDSHFNSLKEKYKNHIILTEERMDLLAVLKNCKLMINTYPICGTSMIQYCVEAGIPCYTLISSDDSKGAVLGTGEAVFEYNDSQKMINDINLILKNADYYNERIIGWKDRIISKEKFDLELGMILNNKDTSFNFNDNTIMDTREFRNLYLNRLTEKDLLKIIGDYKFSFFCSFPQTFRYSINELIIKFVKKILRR